MKPEKIAIIGGGVSGIVSAHLLSKKHHVTLFEAADYLGGHANTRIVKTPSGTYPIDTGFIVFNHKNYPNFIKFLAALKVLYQKSDMSFAYFDRDAGFSYRGPRIVDALKTPKIILNPKFLRLVVEKSVFNRKVLAALNSHKIEERSLSDFLAQLSTSKFLIENYILPLVSIIWSKPFDEAINFPAITFANFFKNHGMLNVSEFPTWYTVTGGSATYIKAFTQQFNGQIHLGSAVQSLHRTADCCSLVVNGETLKFDRVVFATHADQTLKIIKDPTPLELRALTPWRYTNNAVTLHSDHLALSVAPSCMGSWNIIKTPQNKSALQGHYFMNRLQSIAAPEKFFVSLNSNDIFNREQRYYETNYTHPVFDLQSLHTQPLFAELNKQPQTYFCGAYQRYGFHEDGVLSAVNVAAQFGVTL